MLRDLNEDFVTNGHFKHAFFLYGDGAANFYGQDEGDISLVIDHDPNHQNTISLLSEPEIEFENNDSEKFLKISGQAVSEIGIKGAALEVTFFNSDDKADGTWTSNSLKFILTPEHFDQDGRFLYVHDIPDEHLEQSYDTAELSGYFHDFSGANIFVASGDQNSLSVGNNAEWLKTDNTSEIQEIAAAETSLVLANGDLFRVGRGGTAPFNGVETPIRNFGIDEWEPYLVLEGNNVPLGQYGPYSIAFRSNVPPGNPDGHPTGGFGVPKVFEFADTILVAFTSLDDSVGRDLISQRAS